MPSYHEDYSAENQHAETQSHRVSGAQHFAEQEEEQEPEQERTIPSTPVATDQGKCARALYDYQASEFCYGNLTLYLSNLKTLY